MAHETPPGPEPDDINEQFLQAVELILQTLRGQGRFHTADTIQRAIEGSEPPRFRATQLRSYLERDRFRLTVLSTVRPPDAPDRVSAEHMISARKALLDFLNQGDYDLHFMSMRDTVRLFEANKETIAATVPEDARSSLEFTMMTLNSYAEDPDAFAALLERFDIPQGEVDE